MSTPQAQRATGGPVRARPRLLGFLRTQPRVFRVIVARQALHTFFLGLTLPYEAVFIRSLGATPLELGLVSSSAGIASAVAAAPAGWMADRVGARPLFLAGLSVLALAMAGYLVAPAWWWVVATALLASFGVQLSGAACGVTCAASLSNQKRAMGMGACSTLSSAAGLLAPPAAAALLRYTGGIQADSLRALYAVRLAGTLGMIGLMAWFFQSPVRMGGAPIVPPRPALWAGRFFGDFRDLLANRPALQRWVAVYALSGLPVAMVGPFWPVYAHEWKGADALVLALMGTASAAASLVLAVPLGRLADRVGRKAMLYGLAPLAYLAWATGMVVPGSAVMVAAAALWGIAQLGLVVAEAMSNELVPLAQMGRWKGLLTLSRGLLSTPAPLLGGVLWGMLGPAGLFFVAFGVDALVRLPLLAGVRETGGGTVCPCMA